MEWIITKMYTKLLLSQSQSPSSHHPGVSAFVALFGGFCLFVQDRKQTTCRDGPVALVINN